MDSMKLPLRDASLVDVVAAAIVIQTVSSGPDFVTLDRLRETIESMRTQAPGTGWVCAAQVQARGVVTALGLYDLQRLEQSFGDASEMLKDWHQIRSACSTTFHHGTELPKIAQRFDIALCALLRDRAKQALRGITKAQLVDFTRKFYECNGSGDGVNVSAEDCDEVYKCMKAVGIAVDL